MKEHLSPKDLNDLTNAQKHTLRSTWLPEKNDLVAAYICTNVETEEYDEIEFVIGEVLIKDKIMHHQIVLRRLRLVDEPEVEDEEGEADDGTAKKTSDKFDDETVDDAALDEEGFEIPYCEPEQYFNILDCLPLLSIGQMIVMLRKSRVGQNGIKLFIPPDSTKIFEHRLFTLEDNEGEAFESEEICDLLWDAVKTIL